MRQRGSALCCWCIALCLVAAASGRGLLISDQQAQKALDTVTSAAGDIFGQASQALASSGVADSLTPWQRNHTIDAINQRAPEWKTDLGYFIRPQVASVLHNAANNLGPVEVSFLRDIGAPAPAPAAEAPAVAAETAPRSEGGRKLMQAYAPAAAAGASASSAVFAPLAAPGASVAGAAAPDLAQMQYGAAAPGPATLFTSLQAQDGQLYNSYAMTKHKKIAGETQGSWDSQPQVSSSTAQAVPAAYPAQQGVMNAGANVPTAQDGQATQAADPAQGPWNTGSNAPGAWSGDSNARAQSSQGTKNAGSNVRAQDGQAANAAQGTVTASPEAPVQSGQGTASAGTNVPAQAATPAQGSFTSGSPVQGGQGTASAGTNVPAQAGVAANTAQGTVTAGAAGLAAPSANLAQGTLNAGSNLDPQAAAATTNGAKTEASRGSAAKGSLPKQAAASGNAPAQGTFTASPAGPAQNSQGAMNAGSNVDTQAAAAGTSAAKTESLPGSASPSTPAQGTFSVSPAAPAQGSQGALYAGSNVDQQAAAASTKGATAGSSQDSAAKGSLPKQANTHKAAVQGQWNSSPLAATAPNPSASVGGGTVMASNGSQKTLQNGGLQPKSGNKDGQSVSLDPNQPNRLPGPVRLATLQQQQADGYSPPVTPTSATDGTAFAGTPVQNLPGPLKVTASSPLDGISVSGSQVSLVVGTRISTPFFGTGFNFCVDRYFGSFPKVGIVIPSPAQWLLPEIQDIAKTLQTTLQLPPDATVGHGITLEPTSDGILINLPTVQPNNIPDVGIRYGIQIGQAFGYDFGIGIIRDICFITFTTV